jgi:hypothetical protein
MYSFILAMEVDLEEPPLRLLTNSQYETNGALGARGCGNVPSMGYSTRSLQVQWDYLSGLLSIPSTSYHDPSFAM